MRIDDGKVRRWCGGGIVEDKREHLVAFVHRDKSLTIDIFSLVFK